MIPSSHVPSRRALSSRVLHHIFEPEALLEGT